MLQTNLVSKNSVQYQDSCACPKTKGTTLVIPSKSHIYLATHVILFEIDASEQ